MDAVTGLRVVRDRLRRLGHEVVEVPGWETRGRGAGPIRPSGAVDHWTAGPRTGDAPSLRVVTYGREGLRNALCNTYTSRHPRLYIVAARVAWHAGAGSWPGLDGNRELGHEAECSGPGGWSAGQLALIDDLDRVQADVFGYSLANVIDHFEWAPGRKVDCTDVGGPARRNRLRSGTPLPLEEQTMKQGDQGPDVAAWQHRLRVHAGITQVRVDGKDREVAVDGDYGPVTVAATRAWQKRVGIAETGAVTLMAVLTLGEQATDNVVTRHAKGPHGGDVDLSGLAPKDHSHKGTVTVR